MTLALWRVGPRGAAHGLIREADGLHAACGKWNPEEHEAQVTAVAGTPRCPQCSMLTRYDTAVSFTYTPQVAARVRELAAKDTELSVRQLADRLQTTEKKVRYALHGKKSRAERVAESMAKHRAERPEARWLELASREEEP